MTASEPGAAGRPPRWPTWVAVAVLIGATAGVKVWMEHRVHQRPHEGERHDDHGRAAGSRPEGEGHDERHEEGEDHDAVKLTDA